MTNVSPYSPGELDFHFDLDEQNIVKYIPVDLRDGRFGVFVVHRDTREWWRLIAIFSTWERAERYAGVETDCAVSMNDTMQRALELDEVPAPASLPPEPPTRLVSPGSARPEGSGVEPAGADRVSHPEPAPLSDRVCGREGCGNFIPVARLRASAKTRYCSPACSDAVVRERARRRAEIRAAPAADRPEDRPAAPEETANEGAAPPEQAEAPVGMVLPANASEEERQAAIAEFLARKGATRAAVEQEH